MIPRWISEVPPFPLGYERDAEGGVSGLGLAVGEESPDLYPFRSFSFAVPAGSSRIMKLIAALAPPAGPSVAAGRGDA